MLPSSNNKPRSLLVIKSSCLRCILAVSFHFCLHLLYPLFAMDRQDRVWCSSCRCYKPATNFGPPKQNGEPRKTCVRHKKENPTKPLDKWHDFTSEIRAWKNSKQYKLELAYTFDLDRLPVAFGSVQQNHTDQITDRCTSEPSYARPFGRNLGSRGISVYASEDNKDFRTGLRLLLLSR